MIQTTSSTMNLLFCLLRAVAVNFAACMKINEDISGEFYELSKFGCLVWQLQLCSWSSDHSGKFRVQIRLYLHLFLVYRCLLCEEDILYPVTMAHIGICRCANENFLRTLPNQRLVSVIDPHLWYSHRIWAFLEQRTLFLLFWKRVWIEA